MFLLFVLKLYLFDFQVEAALIGEPDNKDLLELRDNVKEVIALQEQVVSEELGEEPAASSDPGSSKEKDIAWKVGDRCLAPSKNGQRFIAVIDGISQNNVAVTFASKLLLYIIYFVFRQWN